jgi:hypothetical protein
MDEERFGIEVIASLAVWFIAVLCAFFFVGAVVGIVVLAGGLLLLGWWIVGVFRKQETPGP